MKKFPRASGKTLGIALVLICLSAAPVLAGSIQDYGQLPGTPASVNFTAWVSPAVPPTQVITEDGFNSQIGPNQGYRLGSWRVATGNFTNPPPAPGLTLAVNAMARRFTSYPDARRSRPAITMAADGVDLAVLSAEIGR